MIFEWKISTWKEAQNGSPWPDWKPSICFFNRTFITWWRRRPPRGARLTHSSISTPSTRHVATRQSLAPARWRTHAPLLASYMTRGCTAADPHLNLSPLSIIFLTHYFGSFLIYLSVYLSRLFHLILRVVWSVVGFLCPDIGESRSKSLA